MFVQGDFLWKSKITSKQKVYYKTILWTISLFLKIHNDDANHVRNWRNFWSVYYYTACSRYIKKNINNVTQNYIIMGLRHSNYNCVFPNKDFTSFSRCLYIIEWQFFFLSFLMWGQFFPFRQKWKWRWNRKKNSRHRHNHFEGCYSTF